jgi:hypothetical protein
VTMGSVWTKTVTGTLAARSLPFQDAAGANRKDEVGRAEHCGTIPRSFPQAVAEQYGEIAVYLTIMKTPGHIASAGFYSIARTAFS